MHIATVPVRTPLLRGERRVWVALVGGPRSGKSTIFDAVASTAPERNRLAGTASGYRACTVRVGFDEVSVIDLPGIRSLQHASHDELAALKYLYWGDERPQVSSHEPGGPPAPLARPTVIVAVVDAARLESGLELVLELLALERPMVVALNRIDEAREKGLYVNAALLSRRLRVPVVPTAALMGQGIPQLFAAAVHAACTGAVLPHAAGSRHITERLAPLRQALGSPEIDTAFRLPHDFVTLQVAGRNPYFIDELRQHFPQCVQELERLMREADADLPRPVHEELHADRHHRAAVLAEEATQIASPHERHDWRHWLDRFFLHPHWGLLGMLAVFAAVLFVVLEVSAWLDAMTAARLVEYLADWQPASLPGVVARAVADGLVGLVAIVVPYMIPLVLLLVSLEEIGLMQRVAFVVDRAFHKIGLHGGIAVPFLLGLGCNVPAIASAARAASGRERTIASALITLLPCSARSAIILAVGGKHLGSLGVIAIFALAGIVIAACGVFLSRRRSEAGPGRIHDIPPYGLPKLRPLLAETWGRTRDILTIVTPLLVSGSVVLAVLNHVGADTAINSILAPITAGWLGLPLALGVPILFGVLRKELSLLMIYQALGTMEIGAVLDVVQISTFLVFLMFYFPCVSTFAVMLRSNGRRDAAFAVSVAMAAAFAASGATRVLLEAVRLAL